MNSRWARRSGTALARLVAPGRMMTDGYELLPRARAWVGSVRAAFDAP